MTALFSGERVSHTDTFILAGVVLALFVGIRTLRKRMQNKDQIKAHQSTLVGFFFVFGMIDMDNDNNEDEDTQPNHGNALFMTMENLYGKEYVVKWLRQLKDEKPAR